MAEIRNVLRIIADPQQNPNGFKNEVERSLNRIMQTTDSLSDAIAALQSGQIINETDITNIQNIVNTTSQVDRLTTLPPTVSTLILSDNGINQTLTGNMGRLDIISQSGVIRFNNAYSFPTTDGAVNEVFTTDGSGNVSWQPTSVTAAPKDAEYVTYSANATLTQERVLTEGTAIDLDVSVAGLITVNFDSTELNAVTWGDGTQASNQWTFAVTGTDPTITFSDGAISLSSKVGIGLTPTTYDIEVGGVITAWDQNAVHGRICIAYSGSDASGYVSWYNGTPVRLAYLGGLTSTDLALGLENSANFLITGGYVSAPNYISTVAAITQPYACTSEVLNTHLNADLLDGYHQGTSGDTYPLCSAASLTFGAGATITWTFNAGATDPVMTFGSNSLTISSCNVLVDKLGVGSAVAANNSFKLYRGTFPVDQAIILGEFFLGINPTVVSAFTKQTISVAIQNSGASNLTGWVLAGDFKAKQNGSNTISYMAALDTQLQNTSTGIVVWGRCLSIGSPYFTSTGVIQNNAGLYIGNQGNALETNAYGIYLDTITGATALNYSIYSAGGAAYFAGTMTASRFTSEVAPGTTPYACTSTTLCDNLNADLLDGNHAAAFAVAAHTHTALTSAATATTLTLTDDAANQTLTGSLGNLTIAPASGVLNVTGDLYVSGANVGIGTAISAYTGASQSLNVDNTGNQLFGLSFFVSDSATGGARTEDTYGFSGTAAHTGSQAMTQGVYGGVAVSLQYSTNTVARMYGLVGRILTYSDPATTWGNVADATCFQSQAYLLGAIGGTITSLYHYQVVNATISVGAITTQYGLYIPALSGAGTNWGIYNLSNTFCGDKLILTQTDGNEYIDSLADGYVDIRATTGIRLGIGGTEQINLIDGVLQPTLTNDVDLGTALLKFKNGYFAGKLTVDGAIDPTMLALDGQAVAPGTDNGTIYYDTVANKFEFRENGAWVTIPAGGGGAPTDATYVVLSLSAGLSDERVLTAGTGMDLADGGAGSTITLNFDSTEIGTTTWGSGYGIVWTFNIGGPANPTLTFATDSITANCDFTATNFVSSVAVGTEPYACTSTTRNTNLHADIVDYCHFSTGAATARIKTVRDAADTLLELAGTYTGGTVSLYTTGVFAIATNVIGTWTAPTTTNPYNLSAANSYNTFLIYGATGQINLPAAASGMNIVIYSTGSFTITINPDDADYIVRDGVLQAVGVSMTLSAGAGNFVGFTCDGDKWITTGYKGSIDVGA